MRRAVPAMLVVLMAAPVAAQETPQATDVTSADIQTFINALPRDRVSDRPIRVVEVTGDYRVGVYGVFRPKDFLGGANLRESSYYTQNLCSDHGLVAWIPLQTLSHEHGPICVCPQSHAVGKLQNDPSGKGEYGESQQYIVPAEHIARYKTTPVLAQPGDAVLFHMDLFHKSGHNASHEIRFTAGVRYHSMLTDDFVPGRLRYVENPAVRKRHLQGAST